MSEPKNESPTADFCGLIMPISEIDGCSETHWQDVKSILTESIESCGLKANVVSNADEIGVIQKRIIENLFYYPIVICDVSGKNPNVMLELGLRLAFDKPVIIVKDDRTSYSFDTSPIEHISYPRDLRFSKIVEFQKILADKVVSTLQKAKDDPNYSPFLKTFGEFSLPKVPHKEIPAQEFMMQQLDSINLALSRLTRDSRRIAPHSSRLPRGDADVCAANWNVVKIQEAIERLQSMDFIESAKRYKLSDDHEHIVIDFNRRPTDSEELILQAVLPKIRFRLPR